MATYITSTLPELSEHKAVYEKQLKAALLKTTQLKETLTGVYEKIEQTSQHLKTVQDIRESVVLRNQAFVGEALELDKRNREHQRDVERADKEMLEVREVQRAEEADYGERLNETRAKITQAKNNYSPAFLAGREKELGERKEKLLSEVAELERELARSDNMCEMDG